MYIYINYYYTYLPHQLYMYKSMIYISIPCVRQVPPLLGALVRNFRAVGAREVALCTAGLFWAVRILFVPAGLDGLKLGNTGDIMM